jgi:hypothetical protein
MKNNHKMMTCLLILTASALGCDEDPADGPCAGASALSGIAVLEVKNAPDDMEEGKAFVAQLSDELAAECKAKGYDESATEALGCYEKNKSRPGYRVWKGCDQKPGKELVSAVVAKHDG